MNDTLIAAVAWIALVLHVVVGIATIRAAGWHPLLPLLNLTIGACVLAYWAYRWYGYLVQGVTWYAIDQIVPVYAVLLSVLSVLSLIGRYRAATLHWVAFGIDTIVLIGAVLFVTFFRMRLF